MGRGASSHAFARYRTVAVAAAAAVVWLPMVVCAQEATGSDTAQNHAQAVPPGMVDPLPRARSFPPGRRLVPSEIARDVDAPALRTQLKQMADSGTAGSLNLVQVVRSAVTRHPSIADALATLAQQTAGVEFSRAGYYPQLRVGLGRGTSNAVSSSAGSLMAQVSASQMLYDFGKVDSSVTRAQALVRRQQALVLRQIDEVGRQAAEAALTVHRYQMLVDLAKAQVDAVDAVLELAQLRANAGLSTRADPIQARARLEGTRAYLGEMNAQLAQWRQRLRTLVGVEGARPIDDLPAQFDDARWVSAEPNFYLLPDVLVAQAERQAVQAQLVYAKASKWPTITLDASVNRALTGINPSTLERRGTYHSIMVNFNVPLYQGGGMDAQIRAAAAEEAATRERIETTVLQAGDQARAWRELALGALGRLEAVEARRKSIHAVRDLYREQYQLGTRSILDLLNAEQEIHQAEADAQGVVHDLWQYRLSYIAVTAQVREYFHLDNTVVQGMELLP